MNYVVRIKNILKLLVKFPYSFLTSIAYRRKVRYTRFYKHKRIKSNIILYETFHGKSMTDSPYAIFKYLLKSDEYRQYTHVWALNNVNDVVDRKYLGRKNIKFIQVHSKAYLKYLASAKYLINNTSFPPYFIKKKGQVYVNTWHGTPLKTLGKDMKGPLGQHKNLQRNFLQTDYLIHPNKYTERAIDRSHDLIGIYQGKIIEEGYPRADALFQSDTREVRQKMERQLHIKLKKRIFLYAPTWRGNVGQVVDEANDLSKIYRQLAEKVPQDATLLLKVHSLAYKSIADNQQIMEKCIPDSFDTDELLSAVDVLITDYSSLFFDFLLTRRPIVFFQYDQQNYIRDRGMYLDLSTLPGPICKTIREVTAWFDHLDELKQKYKESYEQMLDRYCPHDDGHNTKRIVNIVFEQQKTANVYTINNNKQTILMYCGGWLNNGITTSAINLLNHIDYKHYNVIVIDKGNYSRVTAKNFEKVNSHVIKLYRVGKKNVDIVESYRSSLINHYGLWRKKAQRIVPKKVYHRELQRLLGSTKVDIAIDFSGYVPFWTLLFANGNFQKKIIYQHNDMQNEYNKIVGGKYKHKKNFNIIFPLYRYFDKIISVSEMTMHKNLSYFQPLIPNYKQKADFVINMIDYQKILNLSQQEDRFELSGHHYFLTQHQQSAANLTISGYKEPNPHEINFINIGRLEVEKDQEKLIRAFKQIHDKWQDTCLYLVGDGTLKEQLMSVVEELDLNACVIFTGQITNPYVLLQHCDCFVLSSQHEGQPMVLLEALILRKYIIATDTPGARSVVGDDYGEIVDNSIVGIYSAMKNFIDGKPKIFKTFDYQAYSRKAIQMFYDKITLL